MKRVFVISENEKKEILGMYNVISEQDKSVFPGCPTISKNSTNIVDLNKISEHYKNDWNTINETLNYYASFYYKKIGIKEVRMSCEAALICLRPNENRKNVIIVDTRTQFIYLFGPEVKFIAKDAIISGSDKQSTDPSVLAKSINDWNSLVEKTGFKLVNNKYVDDTGKNRVYSPNVVYEYLKKNNMRYTLPGIYNLGQTRSDKHYAGGNQNLKNLVNSDGKIMANAIHGYMFSDKKRGEALKTAKKYLGDVTNPEAKKEFLDVVSLGTLNLDLSNGCINLTNRFLDILKQYWDNAVVLVMSESETNYLVTNPVNYFNKVLYNEVCPSPKSIGAETLDNFA